MLPPVYSTIQMRQAKSNASIVAVAVVHAPSLCHQASCSRSLEALCSVEGKEFGIDIGGRD
jgi:hypothetical protein